MSKNIVIQEGGLGKQLTANKLKTNLVGGGTCLWVPEDEIILTTKEITEDGTYKAADDGATGYFQVTVRGIGIAKGEDADGDDVVAHTVKDPETGKDKIEIEKVPSSIMVKDPPEKLIYFLGEPIDYTGMIVLAMLKSGKLFKDDTYPGGIIPNYELTLTKTNAEASSAPYTVVPVQWKSPYTSEYLATEFLIQVLVPASIKIVTPPTKVTYNDGDPIDLTGIVVKAYTESGLEIVTVPIEELTWEPVTAQYDESKALPGMAYDLSIETGMPQPILLTNTFTEAIESPSAPSYSRVDRVTISSDVVGALYQFYSTVMKRNHITMLVASQNKSTFSYSRDVVTTYQNGKKDESHREYTRQLSSAKFNGKTFFWAKSMIREAYEQDFETYKLKVVEAYNMLAPGETAAAITAADAYVMLFGSISSAGSEQSVVLTWQPPGSDTRLEASFTVTVAQNNADT